MPTYDWRELRKKLQAKQEGIPEDAYPEGWKKQPGESDDDYYARWSQQFNPMPRGAKQRAANRAAVYDAVEYSDEPRFTPEEIVATGYGDYKKDTDIPFSEWIKNPDYRANAQSTGEKLRNAALKMGVVAASTFLDNTAGLLAGLLDIGVDAVNGDGSFTPTKDFINNPFSEYMNRFREWSEERFPNYRTQEEIEDADQWWKHLNANFWGDVFLKNFGFTIGAALSGGLWAKGFNSLRPKTINKAYKAAMAASVGGDKAAEEAFRKVLQGGNMQSPDKIYKTFDSVRKSYERLGVESQIIGGIGASMGEARVEAMYAAKEFRDERLLAAQQKRDEKLKALDEEIRGNEDNYTERDVYDGYGRKVGTQPALKDDAIITFTNGAEEINKDFEKEKNAIEEQADNVASGTFWPNMLLLSLANIVMFGRMFSGGFGTQAKAKVKGKFGNYSGIGSAARTAGKAVGNTLTEGLEELTQKVISESAKDIGNYKIADFNNTKYDEQATKDVSEMFRSVLETTGNVLFDPKSWEEFAVGALTGALGWPTRRGWSGGIIGGIQEGNLQKKESYAAADALNERINTPEFKALWTGLVRHKAYENAKDVALSKENKFAWHGLNDAEILNDVMMFADAGRLDDLEAFAKSIADVDLETVHNLRGSLIDDTDPNFAQKSDESVQEWLQDRGNEVIDKIRQYRNFHDSIDFMSFGTSDKAAVDELIYTKAQLQAFEDRYTGIMNKIIPQLRPSLELVAKEKDSSYQPTERAKRAQAMLSGMNDLTLFGGLALDIKGRAQDKNGDLSGLAAVMIDDKTQEKVIKDLDDLISFSDKPELKRDIEDAQKLLRSRQDFYSKLFDPTFRQKFEQNATTIDKAAENLEKKSRSNTVKDSLERLKKANSLKEYIGIYNSLLQDVDPQVGSEINAGIQSDPKLKAFDKKIEDAYTFGKQLDSDVVAKSPNAKTPEDVAAVELVANALNELDVEELLSNAPSDEEPEITIGKALLAAVGDNQDAQNLVRSILQTRLGDIAKSKGIGMVPGSGEDSGSGEGEGDGGAGGGGAPGYGGGVSQFKHVSDLIKVTTDPNATLFDKIAAQDFSEYPGLSDQEKADLMAEAAARKKYLLKKSGLVADTDADEAGRKELDTEDDEPDDSPRKIRAHEDFVKMDTQSVRGSLVNNYVYSELKKGRVKKYTGTKQGTVATLNWLREHNVQEFIDSGALARLAEAYKNNGKELPIYFLGNPHYLDNNLDANPFVVEYTGPNSEKYHNVSPNVVLAVEMNEENRKILEDFEAKGENDFGVFSDATLITVGEGANATKYQVIGEVWNPTPSDISSKPQEEQEAYKNVKAQANKIFDNAITNSILPQYISEKEKKGSSIFSNEGKWYVAKQHPISDTEQTDTHDSDWTTGDRIYTTLNYIMSGRNETREIGSTEYKKIPLRESMKEYNKYGGEFFFAMPVRDEILYTDEAPEMPVGVNAPEGSLWMATREANGSWGWTYVTIARANEFNFNESPDTNEMVSLFNDAVDTIFTQPKINATQEEFEIDHSRRLDAVRALTDMFYIRDGETVRILFSPMGPQLSIGEILCNNRDEVISALKTKKYRFQVDRDSLNDEEYMVYLMNSGVLRSEMRSFIRKGASFGINFIEDTDADGNKVAVHPRQFNAPISRTAGSDWINVFSDDAVRNVRIGNVGYMLDEDGSVYKQAANGRKGDVITDMSTVANVKAIAELMLIDKQGDMGEYKGRRWIADSKGYQYTELYEREVEGRTVRMQRVGKHGAFQLIYGKAMWDAYMDVAKEVKPALVSSQPVEEPEGPTVEDLKMFDKQEAEKGGGVPTPKKAKTGDIRKGFAKFAKRPVNYTEQDEDKGNDKSEEKVECD